ncbi:aldolase/citrate lyase family protein [Rossellomorea marisflavi]|uniref:aldolase/citrate lyase family protein n=1 Tax=Rossellomorea marisflavi TaxID=189381 RepID=UPI0018CD95D3|nr:aldolase/citrate lyase family protein [Rossellomorea marisflavi]
MYITNNKNIAKLAEDNGVDWIFIDLEIIGKVERQGHLDTVISRHRIEDIKKVRGILNKSELLVRINPIHEGSKLEINNVIEAGADILMLPFFKTKSEVELFVKYINGRAKVCLLWETREAVENIDSILSVKEIDYIHIGLNDLHLSYNLNFMFELLSNGTVDALCKKFEEKEIVFGFGGLAQIGQGTLPAEIIISEHYRLGSNLAILSRSFCDTNVEKNLKKIENTFRSGISNIRDYEKSLLLNDKNDFEKNRILLKKRVEQISSVITN